jgi:hypothetical protein
METIDKPSEKVIEVRCRLRDNLRKNQEIHRSSAFDKNRFLDSEILNEKDIAGLCARIKRRKHATDDDLEKLGVAFFQSESNITTFIKITGAINVLVKEFIGQRQILAAQVLCNLSLGDDICCARIATFSGVYLMIYIRNINQVLMSVSLMFFFHE